MKKAELIFIPSPGAGHVFSTVEMAKIFLARDERLSITVLVMKMPMDAKSDPSSDANPNPNLNPRLKLIDLPNDDSVDQLFQKSPDQFFINFVEVQKPHVREIVAGVAASSSGSSQLAGLVVDMFCTTMIDVGNEFGIPTYVFFTSDASVLGLMFHVQTHTDEHHEDFTRYKNSDAELSIPSFTNAVPASVIPTFLLGLDGEAMHDMFLQLIRRFRETKGIIINTFTELEPYAVQSLFQGKNPPIYPIGPVLHLNNNGNNSNNSDQYDNIMSWLDSQPSSSVVFLCFGSMGSFDEKQVKEIAYALENSGHRFLWSLRKRPTTGYMKVPIEVSHFE